MSTLHPRLTDESACHVPRLCVGVQTRFTFADTLTLKAVRPNLAGPTLRR
jgi:hypothetical protein